MKIATLISSLKTYLDGLTWTSDSGTGTTEFKGIFTYENWGYAESPYVVILDGSAAGKSLTNRDFELSTPITISICCRWDIIDKQDDTLKREEAMLRIREAWDNLKTKLYLISTQNTLGADFAFEPSFVDDEIAEYNLKRRNVTIKVKEVISR